MMIDKKKLMATNRTRVTIARYHFAYWGGVRTPRNTTNEDSKALM